MEDKTKFEEIDHFQIIMRSLIHIHSLNTMIVIFHALWLTMYFEATHIDLQFHIKTCAVLRTEIPLAA